MLVVADAGPLIYLSAVGQLDLLPSLYDRVLVPAAVYQEVVEKGAGLPGSTEVASATWAEVRPDDPDDPLLAALLLALDRGEANALVLAKREKADLVLIDERRGREAARRLTSQCEGHSACS